jgi:tRNA(fMet)-specific endonuclease VapC
MICLDTNVVIALLRKEPPRLVERFTRALLDGELAMSAVVLFELHYGIANSARRRENAERLAIFLEAPIEILAFDPDDAEEAGRLRAEFKARGTPIGPYDVLIAAQARRRGARLVTANNAGFARVAGLRLEDWTAESPPPA